MNPSTQLNSVACDLSLSRTDLQLLNDDVQVLFPQLHTKEAHWKAWPFHLGKCESSKFKGTQSF